MKLCGRMRARKRGERRKEERDRKSEKQIERKICIIEEQSRHNKKSKTIILEEM